MCRAFGLWLGAFVVLMGFGASGDAMSKRADRELLSNPGFEVGADGSMPDWRPFEMGYEVSWSVKRSGATSAVCTNRSAEERRGASAVVVLNQTRPKPIVVVGFSRAEDVSGFRNNDYSIYLDLTYTDGTPLWGQTAPFSVGSHDWQRKEVLVTPAKPIREVYVHALFRHHTGTVWFDDFSARELEPGDTFDAQVLRPPMLDTRATNGWFIRDVAAGSPIVRASESGQALDIDCRPATGRSGVLRTLEVADRRGKTRFVTVYYVERFSAENAHWWEDMRRSARCTSADDYANLTRLGVGATGMQSLYPLACVTSGKGGRAIAVAPDQGACVVRLGYHAPSHVLYAAFDFALCPDSVFNSRHGGGIARAQVVSFAVDPAWGFRDALKRYYALFPAAFERRATKDGLWIPFADPAGVEGLSDFGIAYHEGDNSVASDDRLGILSFRYTEPMTWWMPMASEIPRTYDAALRLLNEYRTGKNAEYRALAESVVNSGSYDEQGRFNVEFQNAPWTNGAVWVLNPNPAMPAPAGEATKASMTFSPDVVARLYGSKSDGTLDGEYLDSLEGWADVLDYRPESLRYSRLPLTFTVDDLRPVVPTWFSVYELARHMRSELVSRGKLLMANATPWRIHAFAPLLDVMGTETNWLPGGTWRPDSDAVFCLRRALCYHKPYLLLQNTDFEKFTPECVERYMQRSMFYAVFPSMFSVDASSRNYWTQPQWYNRDRHLFVRYVPVIARLSAAGWEPVTGARSSDASVYVERYGTKYITLLNDSHNERTVTVDVDPSVFGAAGKSLSATDELSAERLTAESRPVASGGRRITSYLVRVKLEPDQCRVLRLEWTAKSVETKRKG